MLLEAAKDPNLNGIKKYGSLYPYDDISEYLYDKNNESYTVKNLYKAKENSNFNSENRFQTIAGEKVFINTNKIIWEVFDGQTVI